jgi:hypothetical protein
MRFSKYSMNRGGGCGSSLETRQDEPKRSRRAEEGLRSELLVLAVDHARLDKAKEPGAEGTMRPLTCCL